MIVIQYIAFGALFPFYLAGSTLVLHGFLSPEQYLEERQKWAETSWQPRRRARQYFTLTILFLIAALYARLSILWLIAAIIFLAAASKNLLIVKKPDLFPVSVKKKKQSPALVRMMLTGWLACRLLLFGLWCYAWRHLFSAQ